MRLYGLQARRLHLRVSVLGASFICHSLVEPLYEDHLSILGASLVCHSPVEPPYKDRLSV